MRAVYGALIAALVVGCNPPPPPTPPDPHAAEKAALAKGLAKVREGLKDPESARFRRLYVHRNDSGTWTSVCGEVNARNSFGGYVGFRRFVQGGVTGIEIESGDAASERLFGLTWATYCAPETRKFEPPES